MNLTQPPFDDVHVRRAVNFVIDREGLRKAWGGASAGAIATHIAPDAMLGNKLKGYAPYGTTAQGDVAKAKAEMKQSKYDTDKDGICDATACKNIFTVTGDRAVEKGFVPALDAEPEVDRHRAQGPRAQGRLHADPDAAHEHPDLDAARLGQGLRRRADVLRPALRRPQHHPDGQHQLLPARHHARASPRRSASRATSPASRASTPTSTSAAPLVGDARVSCYAALDKKLTRKVVPWVPYLWSYAQSVSSKNVTKFEFDQFGGTIAYAHVAVKSDLTRNRGRPGHAGRGARARRPRCSSTSSAVSSGQSSSCSR